ncbi:MAG TPA: glycosyltransferase family 2 protein, partial [Candidatus Faecivicinus avistercoris]|nr:glycosyltransferase family 2 protein [Candidatus Faecivicinus avistercoris]
MKKRISAIVPCYNEEEALPLFYKRICEVADKLPEADFEFLFINDGSRDGTLRILRGLAGRDGRVRYISFSRNFGKEAGMLAGLEHATGDYVAILDADLQDPPEFFIDMYRILEEGEYDCVNLYREDREGEGKIRSFFSDAFYKVYRRVTNIDLRSGARDFRLMTRQVVDCILQMKEYNRFTKGIFSWVGFNTKWIGYKNVERAAGESKFSFRSLVRYSINGITSFSTAPLMLASGCGIACCAIAVLLALYYLIKTLLFGDPVAGFPTIICLMLLIGGIQLLCIGILGSYLSKTYMETKRRPQYFVKETEASVRSKRAEQDGETALKGA